MSSTSGLEVNAVSREFGGLAALTDVSMEVPIGRRVALVGPNGAGKSTLLNVISGMVPASSGSVIFLGEDVTKVPPHLRVRRGLTRTFQTPRPFASLLVEESVRLVTSRRGAQPLAFQEIVELADLRPILHRRCGALTLGELRRVEIARAMMLDPVLLMLDEPAAGLGEGEIARVADLVQKVVALSGPAVLFVEHHLSLVHAIADDVIVLDQGRRIASGSPGTVFGLPHVREAYFGAT